MNKGKLTTMIFSMVILLSDCIPYSDVTKAPIPEKTATAFAFTSEPSRLPTLTQKSTSDQCTELASIEAPSSNMRGILLMRKGLEYFLLDVKTMRLSQIAENNATINHPIVSPDKKHLIAEVCQDGKCHFVLRSVDQIIKTIPVQDGWVLSNWLDNERITILSLFEPQNVVLLNPFTNDQAIVQLDLPDAYTILHTGTESLMPVSLNPSLERILFYDEKDGGRLVLWDNTSQTEVSSLPHTVDRTANFGQDAWSPDRHTFVSVSPDERVNQTNKLFRIDVEGNTTQLSHFDQQYSFANIAGPVWNPDNRHLGFWLKTSESNLSDPEDLPQHLAVMDTNTGETQSYCLVFSPGSYPAFPIIWSSDGQQIITNTRLATGEVEPVFVDLAQATQSVILGTQGMWVEGWMLP